MSSALLALEGVHGAYGLSRVLHGVTLEARAGEVVSLLGRNGAGKSTTLKAIMSLVEVTEGAVRFDGRDITRTPTHEISRLGVGYVPRTAHLRRPHGRRTGSWAKGQGRLDCRARVQFFPKLARWRGAAPGASGGAADATVARTPAASARLLLDELSGGLGPGRPGAR